MDKKKKTAIILIVIIVLAAAVYFGVTYFLDKDLEEQEKELEMLKQEQVETKSGKIIKTELCNFEDGEFFVKIPVEFANMSQELMAQKYPSGTLPSYAFTNEDGTVNVVLNVTGDSMKDEDIESFIKAVSAQAAGDPDKVKTSVYEKSGHKIGIVEMVTPAVDTDIYNKMAVFTVDGKMRIVSFNCTIQLQEEWQPVGEFIIDSLHFPAE